MTDKVKNPITNTGATRQVSKVKPVEARLTEMKLRRVSRDHR
jgi:hypothetical protein